MCETHLAPSGTVPRRDPSQAQSDVTVQLYRQRSIVTKKIVVAAETSVGNKHMKISYHVAREADEMFRFVNQSVDQEQPKPRKIWSSD